MQVVHRYAEEIPNLGEAIATARLAKNLTQRELAKMIGVSTTLVGCFEREERAIALPLLREIERVLDVQLIN